MVERQKIASFLRFYYDYILEGMVFEVFLKLNLNAKWRVCTGCLKLVNFVPISIIMAKIKNRKISKKKQKLKNPNALLK